MSGAISNVFTVAFKAVNILGLGVPGMLMKALGPGDPDAIVNRLGDISRQTAKEGDPRVIVWGRVRPIGGNIIHCQKPIKRWVVTSTSSGGKGGGKKKQEQRTEHVYRTYAIGVCEGPITKFSRIWRNNKLVYDGRGTAWGARNNGVFLRSFRLYLGGWSQMPDPTLQSIWGAENVPAYRGTAYMVSIDEDLTDQGGMVPQWQFEVERAEYIPSTSKLYGLLTKEDVSHKLPRPGNSQTTTEIRRFDCGDLVGGLPPTPSNVNVQSTSYPLSYNEKLSFQLPEPVNLDIFTTSRSVPVSEILLSDTPTPNNIAIIRQVVRFSNTEAVSVDMPTPNNIDVIPV